MPGIEANVVVIAPGREKSSLRPIQEGHFKTQQIAVEAEGAGKVGDF